jgi:nucleoside-diphosphate-sugar epimerase
MTDARQLAQQQVWAATTPAAFDQAFNVTNGDVFRWKWMWGRIAEYFGLQAADYPGQLSPLETQMADDAPTWRQIAEANGLQEPDMSRLVSPWHTDADLGRPIEVVTDMSKSRRLGFTAYQASDQAFFDVFDQLRAQRLIP